MTHEAQRMAIVTACPEVFVRPIGQCGWNYNNSTVGRILPCIDGDPLKDLNACAEMEKTLRENQFYTFEYPRELFKVITGLKWKGDMAYFFFNFATATAAQRCEAFLLTKGLWK